VRPQIVALATKLRDFLRDEIKSSELLRALAVIGPLVIAYFFLREPAVLNLGLIAISLLIPALRLARPADGRAALVGREPICRPQNPASIFPKK
jgi:hypothetical protein